MQQMVVGGGGGGHGGARAAGGARGDNTATVVGPRQRQHGMRLDEGNTSVRSGDCGDVRGGRETTVGDGGGAPREKLAERRGKGR